MKGGRIIMQFYFIMSLVAAIIVVIFAIMNATPVPVSFFFFKYELSLALIIFISAALGAVIAVLFGLIKQFKFKKQIKSLSTEIETLDNEKLRLKKDITILQSERASENTVESSTREFEQTEDQTVKLTEEHTNN